MVNLNDFENYFNGLKDKIAAKKILFMTNEADLSNSLSEINSNEQPFIVVVIPSSKTNGSSQDDVTDTNYTLIYILSKDDRTQINTFEIQKKLQPFIEKCKLQLIQDKDSCSLMRGLDVSSLHTDPESKLYSRATGWSLSFEFSTDL